jgi:outer membrane immunogenic protein
MRKVLSAAGMLLLAVGTNSVLAADLPSTKGAPVYAPPPPVFSWTGVYLGGQIGIQFGQTDWSRYDPTNTTLIAIQTSYANKGVVGGGHIGYNYQVDQFVLGVEGDVDGTNFNGSGTSNGNNWANTTRSGVEASIRGRVGIALDQALFYFTAGGAYANFQNTAQNPVGTFYAGDNYDRIGWTAGGGFEYAIDSNWSLRVQDLYSDFGHHTFFTGTENIHQGLLWNDKVEAGFSYKFGEPPPPAPPVVAKY